MKLVLLLVTIGILSLDLVQGVKVNLVPLGNMVNCTLSVEFHSIGCIMRLGEFFDNLDKLELDDKAEVVKFSKSCETIPTCFETPQCTPKGIDPEEKKEMVQKIKNYCSGVSYIANDFEECRDKLAENKSKCYKDWDPFQRKFNLEKDEKKKEQMREDSCKNYFGEDNCMKKEVTETCGESDWTKLHDHFTGIGSNILGECGFSKIE